MYTPRTIGSPLPNWLALLFNRRRPFKEVSPPRSTEISSQRLLQLRSQRHGRFF
jgi:hypothetical protein